VSPSQTIGIGDAENDHAFLGMFGTAVAVANALPSIKEVADYVTAGARGAGVIEVIGRLAAGLTARNESLDSHAPGARARRNRADDDAAADVDDRHVARGSVCGQ
jgi:haloacid dehalogenase-like hydrolase